MPNTSLGSIFVGGRLESYWETSDLNLSGYRMVGGLLLWNLDRIPAFNDGGTIVRVSNGLPRDQYGFVVVAWEGTVDRIRGGFPLNAAGAVVVSGVDTIDFIRQGLPINRTTKRICVV